MGITGFLQDHWSLLVLLMGMGIVLRLDIHLERTMIRRIAVANVLMFLYSVACYAESYFASQTKLSIMRPILSACDYTLITFILVTVILIMYPDQKIYLFIPAMLNMILCFVYIPTGIVFRFSEDNHFGRGPLGYLTYFIGGLYLLYLIYNLFRNNKVLREDFGIIFFMSLTSVGCLVFPLFESDSTSHWFNMTIAVNVTLYYVFLLQQFTKRDPLTKLLNRQSYYSDAERYSDHITALVAMDMDGLKEINDQNGHEAGDTALKTLADCFAKAAASGQRLYRIGGDEYLILCIDAKEKDVISLTERIRGETAKTPYSCSVGYAMKTDGCSIDKLYQLADAMLYEDKKQFYERTGKSRRKNDL